MDPFNYFILDDSFDKQYRGDILFGKVFGLFACLAILIACFGLLGPVPSFSQEFTKKYSPYFRCYTPDRYSARLIEKLP